jgi:hypothetical protein
MMDKIQKGMLDNALVGIKAANNNFIGLLEFFNDKPNMVVIDHFETPPKGWVQEFTGHGWEIWTNPNH